ncbi:LexA family protein, partial [Staphylococcus aureus]
MTKLTRTQSKALDFIRSSSQRRGVSPTLREICAHMGYKAIGSAQDVVTALRRKGFLAENA